MTPETHSHTRMPKMNTSIREEIFSLHTRTPGNSRRHWRKDAREAKTQRTAVKNRLMFSALPPFPVEVTLTRCGPRRLDQQNMPGAMKHVIDGIADAYGINDGDPRWKFCYEQRTHPMHIVVVTIRSII